MLPIIRKTVRVLLLNSENELLLMCIETSDLATLEGKQYERFWCTIGGAIENEESIEQAALREIYEESGIASREVTLGCPVWYGSVDLLFKGRLTRFEETYIVARTHQRNVALYAPTQEERRIVQDLRWFSLGTITQSAETFFPASLVNYLPDILKGRYPSRAIKIS